MDRKSLRDAAQVPFYYDVCLELELCDPLKVYEYYVNRKVFARTKDLPADKVSQRIAYKTACKVLEDHFGIIRGTITQRRSTKRKEERLNLTCPTPAWMKKWVRSEPELLSVD